MFLRCGQGKEGICVQGPRAVETFAIQISSRSRERNKKHRQGQDVEIGGNYLQDA